LHAEARRCRLVEAEDADVDQLFAERAPDPRLALLDRAATYKAADQWVISDKLLLDVQWAHVGNNFTLDFHDPALATVQPTFIINSPASLNGRSGTQSLNFRPSQIVNMNLN